MLNTEPQNQHLLVIKDNLGKRVIVLEGTTCSIGRDSTNSIVLHSKLVSRQHAILLRVTTLNTASHCFRIIDGNLQGKPSTNGITINNQRCFSHDLKHGDVIAFGEDVEASYYFTANLSDVEPSIFGESECLASVQSSLSNQLITQSAPNINFASPSEAVLVRLASFPELISNPILEIDLNGDITYLNPAAVKQFPDIQTTEPQHSLLAGLVEKVQNAQESFFVREVVVDGRIFEQSVHYLAQSDLIRSYIVDITEHKRTEAALRESEERWQLALRGSNDGIWDWNVKTSEVFFSNRWKEMRGYQEAEIGNSLEEWSQGIHPDNTNVVMQAVADHFAKKTPFFTAEYQVRCKDGSYIWILDRGQALWDETGDVVRMVSSQTDISDRKQVEALLQQTHDQLEHRVAQRTADLSRANKQLKKEIIERQQLELALRFSQATNQALLNAIPDWMFRINKDGAFVNFKAAKNNNLPLPTEEFLSKNLKDIMPLEIAQPLMNCVKQALATGDVQIFEYQLQVNDNLLYYEARIAVSAKEEVMAIIRDITERKQAEAEICNALAKEQELHELKSRFISMTSHEFRTPLTTIFSSTELLEDYGDKLTQEKKGKHLQRIKIAVKYMTGLLNDVLLISKAEAGKLQCNLAPLNIVQFCQELVEEVKLIAENHTIVFQTQGEYINAQMDEKLLRHIFSNLLSNAVKYSPQGGTVSFELISKHKEAIFRVQDQGIGIPIAEQAQLFNSFHRASNVGTISGTGLGLAIVKKSVDLHGGEIIVDSQVGVGTTFTVKLPLNC